uniref:peptidylprolyl isomerase n=1 Tax=Ciona savignyi TaxID=51511 RepID=H2YF84_CIOSA
VRYHYYGMLPDGRMFDNSYERNGTYDSYVGSGWLIPGMDEGLMGACLNEHRLITIPPTLAYGVDGTGGLGGSPGGWDRWVGGFPGWMGQVGWGVPRVDGTDGLGGSPGGWDRWVGGFPGQLSCHLGFKQIGFEAEINNDDFKGKNIPPSASLVFDIEILDFHNPNDEPEVVVTHEAPECKRKLASSDFVRYHYNGSFMDGAVFDSSGSRGNTLGRGELVLGVERGLMGMCVGEVRKVVIPPHIGYGEQGREDPMIPGSAVLLFTFRLHRVEESLPEGYLFMWTNGAPADAGEAFKLIDEDQDHRVSLPELTSYMLDQVERGRARLRPGMPADDVIRKMFRSQDYNDDRHLSIDEFTLKMSDDVRMSHADDEL